MERNRSIATLQIVGGHPSLDLANTVVNRDGRAGPDLLATYDDLLDWSLRTMLLDRGQVARLRRLASGSSAGAEAALARAKALREAIYRLFSALAAGREAPPASLDLVGREACLAQAGRLLSGMSSGYAWLWPDDGLDAVTGRLAHAAGELLTGPAIARVKECPGRNCGWLFLDTTRNRGRRWCSDRDCGTLARVTRHRSRKRKLECEPS